MYRRFSTVSRLSGLTPTIRELLRSPSSTNTAITVLGHVKSIRRSKNIGFLDINDGTGLTNLNVVVKDPTTLDNIKVGQSVRVNGEWCESKKAQQFEVVVRDGQHRVEVLGDVPEDYPVQKKSTGFQFLRGLPTLRHRTSTLASVLRCRSFLEARLNNFLEQNDFTKVVPPMLTSSDCEGAGEQFYLRDEEFFGKPAALTVSTQLHLEALAVSLNRVYTLTPCFRAEVSHTTRHLLEFWMLEVEICYLENLRQLTTFTEQLIKSVTQELKNNSEDIVGGRFSKSEQEDMKQRWDTVLNNEWPLVTYREALDIINNGQQKQLSFGDDISTLDEKWLSGEHFKSPVFVTNYPRLQKPFYMPVEEDGTVACFDLLLPEIGELVGGLMREHNYELLVTEMKSRGMNIEDMGWYLSTRLNGSVPHGGFGLGFERLVSYLTLMENVREVIPFPRSPESCPC